MGACGGNTLYFASCLHFLYTTTNHGGISDNLDDSFDTNSGAEYCSKGSTPMRDVARKAKMVEGMYTRLWSVGLLCGWALCLYPC